MVDPLILANDIAGNVVTLALPAALWAFLFLLAWEHAPFAESIGFGRRTFWLLLPGALLATFAILPFAPITGDLVAVSFGGAIFPLIVGSLAVGRAAPPRRRLLGPLLLVLAIESFVLLLLVLPVAAPLVAGVSGALGVEPAVAQLLLLVPVLGVVPPLAFGAVRPRPSIDGDAGRDGPEERRTRRALLLLLALVSGVLLATFAASQAIPAEGIVEAFPFYLVPPFVAGAFAVLVAPRVFPHQEGFALPVAYLATTFGVLLGADLLRQPPLYGSSPGGLYTIGGAGVLDLVYLSGLIALASAYAVHRALGRSLEALGPAPSISTPNPSVRLAEAFRAGLGGRLIESLEGSDRAGREAADQARRLHGLGPAPEDRPWEGLPVPGWVVSDQANLDAVARRGTTDGREGFRSWLTARAFVALGRELGERRFGSVRDRSIAFAVDLGLLAVPAAAIWALIVLATPGDLSGILSNLAYNAAIYGFIALAFLYRVLSETWTGSSPGKRWLGLSVRDRSLRPVGFLSALVRNVSVLPVLTIVGIAGALAVALGLKAGTYSGVAIGGVTLAGGTDAVVAALAVLGVGVVLFAGFGAMLIASTAERQRLGDLWAGTWVVRAGPTGARTAGPTAPPARAGTDRATAPGDRSG